MYDRILKEIRTKIRARSYIVTVHADEEMDDDKFKIQDTETCILNGRIIERQKDIQTSQWKYRIAGTSLDNRPMEVVVRLSITGKLIIITVYRA